MALLPPTEVLSRQEFSPSSEQRHTIEKVLCGMCQSQVSATDTVQVNHAVSKTFTAWHLFRRSDLLCSSCRWLLTSPILRVRPWLITPEKAICDFTRDDIQTSLMSNDPVALLVPLSRQKILAPEAEWNTVVNDRGIFPINNTFQRIITNVCFFRKHGFVEKDFQDDFPPKLLEALTNEPQAIDWWKELRECESQGDDILRTALIATRK